MLSNELQFDSSNYTVMVIVSDYLKGSSPNLSGFDVKVIDAVGHYDNRQP